MIQAQLKLKLNTKQETLLSDWLWNLTGVWNWAVRKIELDAKKKTQNYIVDYVRDSRMFNKPYVAVYAFRPPVTGGARTADYCLMEEL